MLFTTELVFWEALGFMMEMHGAEYLSVLRVHR